MTEDKLKNHIYQKLIEKCKGKIILSDNHPMKDEIDCVSPKDIKDEVINIFDELIKPIDFNVDVQLIDNNINVMVYRED